jgi:hypothetical protein
MKRAGLAAMTLLALGGGSAAQRAPVPAIGGSISIHEQVVIRIPQAPRPSTAPDAPQITWRERRGPHCVETSRIAGATLLGPTGFDLVMRGGGRLRVHLESSCPALDYYRGFYVTAAKDGRICADRDIVRSRAGGACQIERFRSLRPHRE